MQNLYILFYKKNSYLDAVLSFRTQSEISNLDRFAKNNVQCEKHKILATATAQI